MEFYRNNFKTLRESRGLTMEQVAEHLNLTRQAVQHWESGENKPSTDNVRKICDLFKCRPEEISTLQTVEPPFSYPKSHENIKIGSVAAEPSPVYNNFVCPITKRKECPFEGDHIMRTIADALEDKPPEFKQEVLRLTLNAAAEFMAKGA